MARTPAVADETVTQVLGSCAGLVHRVLTDPRRRPGLDAAPLPTALLPAQLPDAARDRASGRTIPASPGSGELPLRAGLTR